MNPVPTTGGALLMTDEFRPGPLDQTPVEAREDVLVFTSEPLAEDLEVTGRVRAVLFAATDGPSTDWVARLCDVDENGVSRNVTDGIVRVRAATPGEAAEHVVDLWSTSIVFKAAHRIRVQVTSSNFPRWDRNLNTGEPEESATTARTAHQQVFHDPVRPSRIVLPPSCLRPDRERGRAGHPLLRRARAPKQPCRLGRRGQASCGGGGHPCARHECRPPLAGCRPDPRHRDGGRAARLPGSGHPSDRGALRARDPRLDRTGRYRHRDWTVLADRPARPAHRDLPVTDARRAAPRLDGGEPGPHRHDVPPGLRPPVQGGGGPHPTGLPRASRACGSTGPPGCCATPTIRSATSRNPLDTAPSSPSRGRSPGNRASRQAATGIHSQCPGAHAGGEANLMVATRSVAASAPAEPETAHSSLMARSAMTARPGGAGERSYRPVLLFDVLPDHGEGGAADGAGEVGARPQLVGTPVVPYQVGELLAQAA